MPWVAVVEAAHLQPLLEVVVVLPLLRVVVLAVEHQLRPGDAQIVATQP